MTNELVVLIDPQIDFIGEEGNYAKRHSGINQILDAKRKINTLIKSLDKRKIVIVSSDYEENQFEKELAICIPGTNGHKIDLDINNTHTIISKSQHSCFSSNEFISFLKNNHINKLILCGFLAEYCVKQTAIDALNQGYIVLLMEDCIGTGDDIQIRREQMLVELIEKGAEIIKSSF
jgi:nicotinamidase-related amidase